MGNIPHNFMQKPQQSLITFGLLHLWHPLPDVVHVSILYAALYAHLVHHKQDEFKMLDDVVHVDGRVGLQVLRTLDVFRYHLEEEVAQF